MSFHQTRCAVATCLMFVCLSSSWAAGIDPKRGTIKPRPRLRLTKETQQVLSKHSLPPFMADALAPTAEMLWSWKKTRQVKPGKARVAVSASDLRQHILPIFEATRKPTQYLFAGNGMYHAYLMAKALFRKTPLAKRIHFLPVSGKGRDGYTLDRLGSYFDLIGLDQSAEPIAIVDSFVSGNTLQLSAQAVRQYLRSKGQPVDAIAKRVLMLGIQESKLFSKNAVESVKEQHSAIEEIGADTLVDRPDPKNPPPIVRVGRWEAFWLAQWSFAGLPSSHYWAGKHSSIDERGLPCRGAIETRLLSRQGETARSYLGVMAEVSAALDGDTALQHRTSQLTAR